MKVSGFTMVRNAIRYDYPVVESIKSVLPLVDEMIVLIGNSDDDTLALIENIGSEKIKIHHSIWDDSMREGGRVLAIETNKAMELVSADSDWLFYIQADEVIHEQDYETIQKSLKEFQYDERVEGLLFKYLHFYGSYDFIGDSRRWYRNEIRIIKNNEHISSYRDAQGFRINGRKLNVKKTDAVIYHYGWVKHPKFQQAKQRSFHRMWHDDEWMKKNVDDVNLFDYSQIDSLKKFSATHPSTMLERINNQNWNFSFDPTQKKMSVKNQLLHWAESITGYRIGEYKNYKIIR